jgi:excisionase family DNA binding protein
MEIEDFYTVPEITAKLKVNGTTLHRWIKQGKIGAYRFGRDYRIPKSEFENFINNASVTSKPEGKKQISPGGITDGNNLADQDFEETNRMSLRGMFKEGVPIPAEEIDEVIKEWIPLISFDQTFLS